MEENLAHNIDKKPRTGDVKTKEVVDFGSLLLSDAVRTGLKNAGFVRPSPIQLKAIPLGRCGLDLVIQAKSGTGKTCVFTVISLESIDLDANSTQVLILSPTREIAVQIWEVITSLGSALPKLRCYTFIGGMPVADDINKLKKCHIAVGTPGRIKQLIENQSLVTESVRLFVLDEADKLLEQGFQESINWIYSSLPENKQMLALSATYPESLAQQLTSYMRSPTFVRLNTTDPALLGIRQYYQEVPFHPLPQKAFEAKCQALQHLLSSISFQQCLVFSNYQLRAQSLSDVLNAKGWPATYISGSQEQQDRLTAMAKLKKFKCRVLISTDLTSRGIDAENVNLVVNLDIPYDHETYLHRIGRAGRFGTYGAGVTFAALGKEMANLKTIEKGAHTKIHRLPDPIPADLARSSGFVDIDDLVTTEKLTPSLNGLELPSGGNTASTERTEDNIPENTLIKNDSQEVKGEDYDPKTTSHTAVVNGTCDDKKANLPLENKEKIISQEIHMQMSSAYDEDQMESRSVGKLETVNNDWSSPDGIPHLIDELSEGVKSAYDEADSMLEDALQSPNRHETISQLISREKETEDASDINSTGVQLNVMTGEKVITSKIGDGMSTKESPRSSVIHSQSNEKNPKSGEEGSSAPANKNVPTIVGIGEVPQSDIADNLNQKYGIGPLFTKQRNNNIVEARKVLSDGCFPTLRELEPKNPVEQLSYKDLLADLDHFRQTGEYLVSSSGSKKPNDTAQRQTMFVDSLKKVSDFLHRLTLTNETMKETPGKLDNSLNNISEESGLNLINEQWESNAPVDLVKSPFETPVLSNTQASEPDRIQHIKLQAPKPLETNDAGSTSSTLESVNWNKGARPKEPIKQESSKTRNRKERNTKHSTSKKKLDISSQDKLLGLDYMKRLAQCIDQNSSESDEVSEYLSGDSSDLESDESETETDADDESGISDEINNQIESKPEVTNSRKYSENYRKSKWEQVKSDQEEINNKEEFYGSNSLYDPSQPWNREFQDYDGYMSYDAPAEEYDSQQAWDGEYYDHSNAYYANNNQDHQHQWGHHYFGAGDSGYSHYPYDLWMQCSHLLSSMNAMQAYHYSLYCQQQEEYHKKWAEYYQKHREKQNRFQQEFQKQQQNISQMSEKHRKRNKYPNSQENSG